VRIYQSRDADCLPPLVYFHGGGFVLGEFGQSHATICRALALQAGCVGEACQDFVLSRRTAPYSQAAGIVRIPRLWNLPLGVTARRTCIAGGMRLLRARTVRAHVDINT
jgi:hypothetical protein